MAVAPRSSLRCRLSLTTALVGGVIGIGAGMPAQAQLPGTATVDAGAVGFRVDGVTAAPDGTGTRLDVDLGSTGSIITWNTFDIGTANTVMFNNGTAGAAAVLNRVTGGASAINGALLSDPNVSVYLINPSGITFGTGANVNVGALIASTLDLADGDFLDPMTGTLGTDLLNFTGPGSIAGITIDGGTIRTTGDLVFLGATINGSAGTDAAAGGNLAYLAGTDITMRAAANSPLGFTIASGTTVQNAITANGTIAGRNVTLAYASQQNVVDSVLNVGAAITATSAQVSDRGIILSAGATVLGEGAGGTTIDGTDAGTGGVARIAQAGGSLTTVTGVGGVAGGLFVDARDAIASDAPLAIVGGGTIGATTAGPIALSGTAARAFGGALALGGSTTTALDLEGDIVAGGALTATAGTIAAGSSALSGEGIVILAAMGDAATGALDGGGGAVTLDAAGALSTGAITAAGALAIGQTQVPTSITIGGAVDAGSVFARTSGAAEFTGDVAGTGGVDIQATGTGAITLGSVIASAGGVTVTAAGAATLTGTVTAGGGDLSVRGSSVTLGATGGTAVNQSASGAVNLTADSAGITGRSGLILTSNTAATGAQPITLAVQPGQAITFTGATLVGGTSADRAPVYVGANGPLTLGDVTASTLATSAATRQIARNGGTISFGTLQLTNALDVAANMGGSLSTGAITIAGPGEALTLVAANSVGVGGAVTTQGAVTITAGIGALVAPQITAAGDVALTAQAAAVSVPSVLSAGGALTITGTSVTLGNGDADPIGAAGAVTIVATGAGGITGNAGLVLTANRDGPGGDVLTLRTTAAGAPIAFDVASSLVGGVDGGRSAIVVNQEDPAVALNIGNVTGSDLNTVDGVVTPGATQQGVTRAGNLRFGNVDLVNGFAATSTAGSVTVGSVTVRGAGQGITLSGQTALVTPADMIADGPIALTSGTNLTLGQITSTSATVSATAANNVTVNTGLSGRTGVTATATAGTASIAAASAPAGSVALTSGAGMTVGTAEGIDIALNAQGGTLVATTLSARDDIALRATGAISGTTWTSGTTVGGLAPVDQAGAADMLLPGIDLAGNDIDVAGGAGTTIAVATARALGAGSDVRLRNAVTAATDDLDLAAGGDLTIGGNASGRDVALSAGGTVTADIITARDDVAVRAGTALVAAGVFAGRTVNGNPPVDALGTADTLAAPVDLTGNDIDVTAPTITVGSFATSGDIRLRGAIGSGGPNADVDLAAGGDIATGDLAGRDVALDAGGAIATGAITARDDIALRAAGGVTTGALTSGGTVGGAGAVDVAGSADTLLAGVDLAGNDIDAAGAGIGISTATANNLRGDLRLLARTAGLTLTTGSAGSNATLTKQTITGDLTVGDTLTVGTAANGTAVATIASGGNARLGTIVALADGAVPGQVRDIAITATGDVTGTAIAPAGDGRPVDGFGRATLTAARDVTVQAGRIAQIGAITGRDVTVSATSGAGEVAGTVIAGRDYRVTGQEVRLGTLGGVTQRANGLVRIVSTGGAITGGTTLTLIANADDTAAGAETLILDATGGGIAMPTTALFGGLSNRASNIGIRLATAGSALTLGSVSARSLRAVDAAGTGFGSLATTGDISFSGDVSVRAALSIRTSAAIATQAVTVTGFDGDLQQLILDGASITAGGTLAAQGSVRLTASGPIALTSAGGQLGAISNGGNVVLTAADASGNGVQAAGDITETVNGANNIVSSDGGTPGVLLAEIDPNPDAGLGAPPAGSDPLPGPTPARGVGDVRIVAGSIIKARITAARDILAQANTGDIALTTGNAGRDIALTAPNGAIAATTLIAGDDIAVRAAGAATGDSWAAAGSIDGAGTADALLAGVDLGGSDIDAQGASLVLGSAFARANGAARSDLRLTATAGRLELGTGEAAATATLTKQQATDELVVTGTLTAGLIPTDADGSADADAIIASATAARLNTIVSRTGNVTVTATGDVTGIGAAGAILRAVPVTKDVTVNAGPLARLASATAGRHVAVTAGTIEVGTGQGRDIALNATTGALTATTLIARDDIALRAAGAVTGTSWTSGATIGGVGPVDEAGVADALLPGVSLAGNDIDVAGTTVQIGSVTALGAGSDVRIAGALSGGGADGDLAIGSAGDILLTATVQARDVALNAGGAVSAGAIFATDDIAIRAGGSVATGALTSGTAAPADPTGAADALAGTALTGGDIDVQGASFAAPSATATGDLADIRILATSGALTLNDGSAGAAARLEKLGADGDLTVSGALTTGVVTAASPTTILSSTNIRLGTITARTGSIDIANTELGGEVTGIGVDGRATLSALDPNGDILLASGSRVLLASATVGRDLSVTSAAIGAPVVDLTLGSAGRDIFLAGPIVRARTLTAGDDLAIRAELSVAGLDWTTGTRDEDGVVDATLGTLSGSDVDVVAQLSIFVGSVRAQGAGSDVRLTSQGLFGGDANGDLAISAGGEIILDGPTRGRDVALAAGRAIVSGTIEARDDIVTNSEMFGVNTGALTSGATVLGQGPIDAVGAADALAAGVDLTGNDIEVLGFSGGSVGVLRANGGQSDIRIFGTATGAAPGGDFDALAGGNVGVGGILARDGAIGAGGNVSIGTTIVSDDFVVRAGGAIDTAGVTTGGFLDAPPQADVSGAADMLAGAGVNLAGNDIDISGASFVSSSQQAFGIGSDLRIAATSGRLETMSSTAAGDISLTKQGATDELVIAQSLDAAGGVTISSATNVRLGTVQSRTAGINLTAAGDVSTAPGAVANLFATQAIGVTAGGAVSLNEARSTGPGATLAIDAASVTGNRLSAAGPLTLTARAGSITAGSAIGGTVTFTARDDVTVVDLGSERLTVRAGGATSVSTLGASAGAVDIDSGSVAVGSVLAQTDLVAVARRGDLLLSTGDIRGAATLTTLAGDIRATTLDAGGAATFTSASDARLGDVVARGGDVRVTATAGEVTGIDAGAANLRSATGQVAVAGGTLARLGTLDAATQIAVAADRIAVGTAAARGGSLRLIADAGAVTLGTGTASTSATIDAAGTATVTGTLTANGGNATIVASDAAIGTVGASQAIALTARSGGLTLGTGIAGTSAAVNSVGTLTVTGALAANGGDATVRASGGDIERITASRALNITATSGALGIGTATAGTAATVNGAGALAVRTLLAANGGDLGVTVASATVASATASAAMTLNATAGSFQLTNATAGTTFELNAANEAVIGLESAPGTGGLSVGPATRAAANSIVLRANEVDLFGPVTAGTVLLVNRSPVTAATATMRLGDGLAADGFTLSATEINRITAASLAFSQTFDGAARNVQIGTLPLAAASGSARIDVLTTGRIDIAGTISAAGGAGAARVLRLGGINSGGATPNGSANGATTIGTPDDAVRAAAIVGTATPAAGGRILLTGASTIDLRANRIVFGQAAGFVDALGLSGSGTGVAFQTVASDYLAQPNSTLYNAAAPDGNPTRAYAEMAANLLTATTLTVRYGDYALFQNTSQPTRANPNSGITVNSFLNLTSQGPASGASGPNGLALFGIINGLTGSSAALQGQSVIAVNNVNPANARINGCLIGSGGGGCLISAVTTPQLNIFDQARANIFRTAEDLAVQFDPVVGTNNESLFSDLGTIDFQFNEQKCDPASDATCPQDTGTDQ